MATIRDINIETIVATSSLDDGVIVQLPSGYVGCVQALGGAKVGDLVACHKAVAVELVWNSLAPGIGGQVVDYDTVTRTAMTQGAGSFAMGILGSAAQYGKTVLVLLNAQGAIVPPSVGDFSSDFSSDFY